MTATNKTLEEILSECTVATNISDGKGGVFYDFKFTKAIAQIEAHYISKDAVVRAIGRDSSYAEGQPEADVENRLRAEIRSALKLDDLGKHE